MTADAVPLLSPQEEARAFWRMRRRVLGNLLSTALERSRLRASVVAALSVAFWAGLFLLSIDAFHFLTASMGPGPREETVRMIFGVFFVALLVMLIFSSAIILYSLLYRDREPAFLFTMPARAERVFVHKLQEALLFSSWGFVLLGTPMLVAYGAVADAPWYYFPLLVPFTVTFVWIPCSLGGIACLLVVHLLPHRRRLVLLVAGAGLVSVGVWTVWNVISGPDTGLLSAGWFQDITARLQFSQQRLLPSWWLSTGLLEAASGGPNPLAHFCESLLFLGVMTSNALLLHLVAVAVSGRIYRTSYSDLHSGRSARAWRGPGWFERMMVRLTTWLPHNLRLLIVKDVRLFRRDPVQWSQFLIFFGLLCFYFLNLRWMVRSQTPMGTHLISLLNLAVVGLILSTFTNRFIFPLISLEGRRFWVLGRLPVKRGTILAGKFVFAFAGSIVPCAALVLVSDYMLSLSPALVALHLWICLLLCLGLSGLAVGLGARLPNLRAESPAKIAAGFGGTLTLVLSGIYIVAVVALAGLPAHIYLAGLDVGRELSSRIDVWMWAGLAVSTLLGVVATLLPMQIGLRAFRRMEF